MRYVLSAVCAILALGANDAVGEETTYGGYRHHDRLPNVLLLVGEISNGDSFELRRAMRDHQIDLVVAASPGGSVYEGLQMASILRDKDVGTYIPDKARCESSCASVFLGGSKRMVVGELGVHQFYSGAEDARSQGRKDVITTVTQYTTSDIIGILNEFDTPPFVYEKMFRTTEIYYFNGAEKQRIGLGISDETFVARIAEVDEFLSSTPGALERTAREPETSETAQTIPPSSSAEPSSPKSDPKSEKRFENTDFFGMDLSPRGLRNVSLLECENYCRRTDACAAWSYVHATRWCWPKSGIENISLASNVTSGITDPGRINPEIFSRPFLEATGLDIRGYDLYPKGLRNMTLDQCRHACQATNGCVAWSYVPKKSWCFPKYGVGQYESRLGIVSGVVKAD